MHAGDFTRRHCDEDSVKQFNTWLGSLRYKHKVVIAGNHDTAFEHNPDIAKLLTNCTYLRDSSTVIDGVKFYGAPWQPEFCNWAFNLKRHSSEMREKWEAIPDNTDVLITHGPPYGILDLCPDMRDRSKLVHAGCEVLREQLNRIKPKVHIFGHIHEGSGIHKEAGTQFINASFMDSRFQPNNQTRIVELDEEGARIV